MSMHTPTAAAAAAATYRSLCCPERMPHHLLALRNARWREYLSGWERMLAGGGRAQSRVYLQRSLVGAGWLCWWHSLQARMIWRLHTHVASMQLSHLFDIVG